MRNHRIPVLMATSAVFLAMIMPQSILARPKQLVNGCTAQQIQSNFGNSCVDQMQQDLINNRSYTHALVCNGGEVLCCTYDNTTNQIQTCRRPAGTKAAATLGTTVAPNTGTVLSRGVDEDNKDSEDAPVPSWMTEERLKALSKDSKAK